MDSLQDSAWVGTSESKKLKWIASERIDKFSSALYWTSLNMNRHRFYPQLFAKQQASDVQNNRLLPEPNSSIPFPMPSAYTELISSAVETRRAAAVKLFVYSPPGTADSNRFIPFEFVNGHPELFKPTKTGETFGPSWSTHWFRVEVDIPREMEAYEIHFIWDSDCEGMIWRDGHCIQGLTGGDGCDRRAEYIIHRPLTHPKTLHHVFFVEMACNSMFGTGQGDMIAPSSPDRYFTLKQAEIAAFDRGYWDMFWDFNIVSDMSKELPTDGRQANRALRVANQVINEYDPADQGSWARCAEILKAFLQSQRTSDVDEEIFAVGHCHIDTAWLWSYAETKRKCARSWSAQLGLLSEFPAYVFTASQAQQFAWVEQHYPLLFDQIKGAVAAGRFVPVGGTWIEMDCNIPSGESMVRQFLYGQQYFQKRFGVKSQVFWLPDTFGYSAQLPQIVRQCGMKYFLTQKLSWNLVNTFPYHTFTWEGLDGSQVLTHFPPGDTYNGQADVKSVVYNQQNYKQKAVCDQSLMLFGNGDGGGGPKRDMIERLQRMSAIRGLPAVKLASPQALFHKLEASQNQLARWVGELYFELHRGTYTTQAAIKRGNRECELLLRNTEFATFLAHTISQGQFQVPFDDISALWKDVLLNQFHDVAPGSCIADVVTDAVKLYDQVRARGAELCQSALKAIAAKLSTGAAAPKPNALLVVNSLPFERTEHLSVPELGLQGLVRVPPMGYAVITSAESKQLAPPSSASLTESATGFILSNELVRVTMGRDGRVKSVFDLGAQRECIDVASALGGNNFVVHEDVPFYWDAWDVELHHLQKKANAPAAKSASVIQSSGLFVAVKFQYQLSEFSTLTQVVKLHSHSIRVDFECEVDWHEKHKILKVEFPLAIRANEAKYEIQYGHVSRPTHVNTSWDLARFEVVGHKWADLSEHGYGVALLNDCKYGYSCQANVLRLSLLRAPTRPDPTADMGLHRFRYALFPHAGSVEDGGVIREGFVFNTPLLTAPITASAPVSKTIVSVDKPGLILDCVKRSEDSPSRWVVRLYEGLGGRGTARLSFALPVKRAELANLLEEPTSQLQITSDGSSPSVNVSFVPFQIVTVLLHM